jgi:hypothetical protein
VNYDVILSGLHFNRAVFIFQDILSPIRYTAAFPRPRIFVDLHFIMVSRFTPLICLKFVPWLTHPKADLESATLLPDMASKPWSNRIGHRGAISPSTMTQVRQLQSSSKCSKGWVFKAVPVIAHLLHNLALRLNHLKSSYTSSNLRWSCSCCLS